MPSPRKPEPFLSLGFAAVDWIEHYLVHGPGDVQGQPVELDDEFAAFIVKAYQLDRRGQRKVRRAFLSRSKGRSKSGLAAMIECFEALGPCRFDHWAEAGEVSPWGYEYELGEPVGAALIYVECLNVATEEGQAGNTYDAVYYMLNPETAAAALVRDYGRIEVGLARTTLPNSRGFLQPVSARDTSKDGGKSTFIVADETHLWLLPRMKELHGIMARNLLKRRVASGWMLETSTMYAVGDDSVAEGTHAYARSAAGRDGTLLFDHRQASEKWDLTKRPERLSALREAYGPASAWMDLGAICNAWDDPQVSEASFRRYWLNQPVGLGPATVIPLAAWADLADNSPEPSPHVGVVFLAVDTDPLRLRTSIAACGVREDGLPLVELVENLPGVDWATGRLVQIAERNRDVAAVVIDKRSAAASLIGPLADAGLNVIGTDAAQFAAACGQFFDAATETRRLRHLGQVELAEALKAASIRVIGDAWGWDRKRPSADITPLTAVTLALYGYARTPVEEFVMPARLR